MIDFGVYEFKYLNTGKFTPDEYFMDAFVDELFELLHVCNSTE